MSEACCISLDLMLNFLEVRVTGCPNLAITRFPWLEVAVVPHSLQTHWEILQVKTLECSTMLCIVGPLFKLAFLPKELRF